MTELGVNIDHVATVRQARRTNEPDPVWAATLAQLGGADGITLHFREDRRHIQDRDSAHPPRNRHGEAEPGTGQRDEVLAIACQTRPDQATLVPETREEVTTEGGLDLRPGRDRLAEAVRRLAGRGHFRVSLFLDPDPEQVAIAKELEADAVELHTGEYALARGERPSSNNLAEPQATPGAGDRRRARAARRPRADLSQRAADRRDPAHERAEHRPQHRGPGPHGRL